jgi:nucleoid-associated protein YgaU
VTRHHHAVWHDPAAGALTVRAGDSLWAIAARHPAGQSTAAVAAAWPRWYAANRAVIGPQPDLIYPGERLLPPPPLDRRNDRDS